MRRKIVLQGGVALTVSLPTKWARKNSIMKGDEVDITESNNSLIIQPSGKNLGALGRLSNTIKYHPGFFKMQIASLYEKGYDEIIIDFSEADAIKDIEQAILDLIGFVVVEQTQNKCNVRCISQPSEDEFKNILRRNFLVIIEMSSSLLDFAKTNSKDAKAQINEMKHTSNKLSIFCKRFLLKNSSKDSVHIYSLLKDMEKISDQYAYLSLAFSKGKNLFTSNSIKIVEETNKFFKSFYRFFYNGDAESINELQSLKAELDKMFSMASSSDIILTHNLQYIADLIHGLYLSAYTRMS